jgi:hypothetical protein
MYKTNPEEEERGRRQRRWLILAPFLSLGVTWNLGIRGRTENKKLLKVTQQPRKLVLWPA